MAHDLTLWGAGTGRTMRAHWMLLELGLEYEFHPVQARTGETQTDEFKQLNPRHNIPVLRHGSFVLTESAAIIQYLDETFANPKELYVPSNASSRATLNEWCYFIVSELDAASLYVVRRHEALQHVYGEAPDTVETGKEILPAQPRRDGATSRERGSISTRRSIQPRRHPFDDLS